MADILKHSKIFFLFFLAFTIVLFYGSSETIGTDLNDPDNIEAQNLINKSTLNTFVPISPKISKLNSDAMINTGIVVPSVQFSLADTFTINAHPGPPNNGGSPAWAIFFDLISASRNINVTQMSTGSTAAANSSYSVEVFTREGTALGGPVGSGPGSSMAGWTLIGTVPVVQGPTGSGISLVFNLPVISVPAGDTVGVAVRFLVAGPRYFGTGSPPLTNYSDTNLAFITGEGRSMPFTPSGTWFSSRALTGVIRYVLGTPTGIGIINSEIPNNFSLAQNYPNPFNPSTTIEFAVPNNNKVTLKVYNIHGQEITSLVNGEYSAGSYKVVWDASRYSSGVYFYSLQADNFSQTKKLILIK